MALRDVQEMEGRMTAHDSAFDSPVSDDDDSAFQSPVNYLEDRSFEPAAKIEHDDYEEDSNKRLQSALAELDDRSRDIIMSRWLSDQKATLHEASR